MEPDSIAIVAANGGLDFGMVLTLIWARAVAFAIAITFSLAVLHHGLTIDYSIAGHGMPLRGFQSGLWGGTLHAKGRFPGPGTLPRWPVMFAALAWAAWAFVDGLLRWLN